MRYLEPSCKSICFISVINHTCKLFVKAVPLGLINVVCLCLLWVAARGKASTMFVYIITIVNNPMPFDWSGNDDTIGHLVAGAGTSLDPECLPDTTWPSCEFWPAAVCRRKSVCGRGRLDSRRRSQTHYQCRGDTPLPSRTGHQCTFWGIKLRHFYIGSKLKWLDTCIRKLSALKLAIH